MTTRDSEATVSEPAAGRSREEILRQAANLISERGYHAVSIVDISRAVGLSKATVYHHFRTKEEILGTIIIETLKRLVDHITQSLAGCSNPEERLMAFIVSQAEFFEMNLADFMVTIARTDGVEDAVMRKEIGRWRADYERLLNDLVTDGVASGHFRPYDTEVVRRAVLSLVYWLGRWYRPGAGRSAAQIAREHTNLLLQGLRV